MVAQTEQMLVEAWEKFCDYYDTKAPKYRRNWRPELNEKQAKESHWICWNEYDLTVHIGRFFYDILSKKKEEEFLNIEVHLEKNVNYTNFNGYEFNGELEGFINRLKQKGVIKKRGPKIDMIVACEDSNASFLLCAEVKYFHYASKRYNKTPIQKINADIEKLKAIRDYKIAKRVVFMLFDDYYWYTDEKAANAIQERLDEIRHEDGITVLFHTSEAKMCGFRPDC